MERKKYLILGVFAVLLIVGVGLAIGLSPKTLEEGNGWKHQIGDFDECEMDGCDEKSTHRIKAIKIKHYYCDKHWEEYGADLFYRLSDERTNEDKEFLVKTYAISEVKKELIAPGTAEFCQYYEMRTYEKSTDRWLIQGYVDAENIFGAKIREYWIVELTLTRNSYEDAEVVFKNN